MKKSNKITVLVLTISAVLVMGISFGFTTITTTSTEYILVSSTQILGSNKWSAFEEYNGFKERGKADDGSKLKFEGQGSLLNHYAAKGWSVNSFIKERGPRASDLIEYTYILERSK